MRLWVVALALVALHTDAREAQRGLSSQEQNLLAERAMQGDGKDAILDDAAFLLLDQARIVDGEPLADPLAFSRRMAKVMEQGLMAG